MRREEKQKICLRDPLCVSLFISLYKLKNYVEMQINVHEACVSSASIPRLRYCGIILKLRVNVRMSCGPMDKASAHGAGDCRFESYQDHANPSVSHNNHHHSVLWLFTTIIECIHRCSQQPFFEHKNYHGQLHCSSMKLSCHRQAFQGCVSAALFWL